MSHITIPTKKAADKIEYAKFLGRFIEANYPKDLAASSQNALRDLQQASDAVRAIGQADEVSRDLLKAYLAQVDFAGQHFPMLDVASSPQIKTEFVWYDAFNTKKRSSSYSLHLERAAATFNLAAIHSQMGASLALGGSPDGLKIACSAFQSAAGAFQFLRDAVVPQLLAPPTPDLSSECLAALVALMLAQAQACFCDRAARDGMKAGIIAKLSAQAHTYFQEAQMAFALPSLASSFEKSPLPLLAQVQSLRWAADAQYRQALACQEAQRFGEGVARLQQATNFVKEGIKLASKGASAAAQDELSRLAAIIARALETATRENNTIYVEPVPQAAQLAPIERKPMVRAAGPEEAGCAGAGGAAAGSDPWVRLVPVHVQKAQGELQGAVQRLVGEVTAEADRQTTLAKKKLEEKGLPSSLSPFDPEASVLPDSLHAAIVDIRSNAGKDPHLQLLDLQTMNAQLCREDEAMFAGIEKALEDEEAADGAARRQAGTRWSRPQSRPLAKVYWEELSKHRVNLQRAKTSDAVVQQKLEAHRDLLEKLTRSDAELRRMTPQLQLQAGSTVGSEAPALLELCREVDAVLAAREALIQELRIAANAARVAPESPQVEAALRPLDALRGRFEENYGRQRRALDAIDSAWSRFQGAAPDFVKARGALVAEMDRAVAMYREIHGNYKEGIEFYSAFQDALRTLKLRVEDWTMGRRLELEDHASQLGVSLAALNLGGPSPSRPAPAPAASSPSPTNARPAAGSPAGSGPAPPSMAGPPPVPPQYAGAYGQPPYGAQPAYAAAPYPPAAQPYPPPYPPAGPYGAPQPYPPYGQAPVYNYGQPPAGAYPPYNMPPNQPYGR
eukprot:tig00020610_g11953.t1